MADAPDQQAEQELAAAEGKALAERLASYHQGLISNGMDEDFAKALVLQAQTQWLGGCVCAWEESEE